MRLQLALKKTFAPRHHPPATTKVLQTTRNKRLSPQIYQKFTALHTRLIMLALLPKQVQETHDVGLFQSCYFITTSKIS